MAQSSFDRMLKNISERLKIDDAAITKKGEEYFRVFQNKGALKTVNNTAQAILCFDLASSQLGISFDKENAIRISGLKKTTYQNSLHTVEKILNLNKTPTIQEICVQCSCTVIKDVADKILESYKGKNPNLDYNHPQYAILAVYTACRLKHVKIQKLMLTTMSRLRPSQWKELEAEFFKCAESLGIFLGSKGNKKQPNELLNYIEEVAKEKEIKTESKKSKNIQDAEIEGYEIWKKKMLDQAREMLRKRKLNKSE